MQRSSKYAAIILMALLVLSSSFYLGQAAVQDAKSPATHSIDAADPPAALTTATTIQQSSSSASTASITSYSSCPTTSNASSTSGCSSAPLSWDYTINVTALGAVMAYPVVSGLATFKGTDACLVIQDAVGALSRSGGAIAIGPGTYKCNAGAAISTSSISLVGAGSQVTRIESTSSNTIFSVSGTNVLITDMAFMGDGNPAHAADAMDVTGGQGLTVSQVQFGGYNAAVDTLYGNGVDIMNGYHFILSDDIYTNINGEAVVMGKGVSSSDPEGLFITDSDLENVYGTCAIDIRAYTGFVTITGNNIDTINQNGVCVANQSRVRITSNDISAVRDSAVMGGPLQFVLQGNNFYDDGYANVPAGTQQFAVTLRSCDDCAISGNTWHTDPGTQPPQYALVLGGRGSAVVNSTVTGNTFDSGSYVQESIVTTNVGIGTYVEQNSNANPFGRIADAWTSSTVGLTGTRITPGISGSTYRIEGDSFAFSCTGGGAVSIAIKDGSGDLYQSGYTCSSLPATFWPVGFQLTISNSSDFTSFTAFGE